MKNFKKILALIIACMMTLTMASAVFAQTAPLSPADDDNATITINNPAKGETYTLYKLFDATVSNDSEHNIAYQGTVPTVLEDYFSADANGNISPKDVIKNLDGTTKMTDDLKAGLEAWAKANASAKVIDAVSDGSELQFTKLPYGYYVMVTSHKSDPASPGAEAKAAISVTSTQPTATINDKNVNNPSAKKEADKESYSVGDTITYTATFDAPNYMEKEDKSGFEQVVSYTIKDTLPDFLTDVDITSVKIKQPGVDTDVTLSGYTKFDPTKKSITIPWVNETPVPNETHKYTSTYKAGSQIIITYTAKLNSNANIGAENKNTVSIMPNVDRNNPDGPEPWDDEDHWSADETVYTYAAALIKVDKANKNKTLTGAKFQFKGLVLASGEDTPGVYTVVSYNPNATDYTGATEVEVDSNGKLIIAGLEKGKNLVGKETVAPKGYNLIVGDFNIPVIELGSTTTTEWGATTVKYDADGNVVEQTATGGVEVKSNYKSINTIEATAFAKVENSKGVLLPSTGGIGTTIFYIIGGILILGAAIALIGKKRFAR